MAMTYLLYNEFAEDGKGKASAEDVRAHLLSCGMEIAEENMVSLNGLDPQEFFAARSEDDIVVIDGGDGTMNHLMNNLGEQTIPCPLYLHPNGTGNDFVRDLPQDILDPKTGLYPIGEFLKDLPFAEVKGKKYRFLNGIGFGIDGECCVKAEEMKALGQKDINYGAISVKLLFGPFEPPTATVRLNEGEPFVLPKAYLASAMNGAYYGGGMAIAPNQRRGSGELTFVAVHGKSKLATLFLFPKIYKGTHIKNKSACYIAKAKTIEVRFDRPCGLQIDGEVLTGVTEYKAYIAR